RLAPMPPTTAARWMTRSGRASERQRRMSSASRRSYSALRGTKIRSAPRRRSSATTALPRNPLPPVTRTALVGQNEPPGHAHLPRKVIWTQALQRHHVAGRDAGGVQVVGEHDPDQVVECGLRLPAEPLTRARRVAAQFVHLGGAEVARVDLDVFTPVEADRRE